jgi:hypothetical protein
MVQEEQDKPCWTKELRAAVRRAHTWLEADDAREGGVCLKGLGKHVAKVKRPSVHCAFQQFKALVEPGSNKPGTSWEGIMDNVDERCKVA